MTVTKRKSPSVSQLRDARARRTRERVDGAFVALLHVRAYDRIRVSDVVRKSGVGRATFYAHYRDKDALLRSQMDRFVVPLLRPAPEDPTHVDATALFAHLRAVPLLYRSLMGGPGRRVVEQCVEARLVVLLSSRSARRGSSTPVAPPLVARVLAASLIGLLSFWADAGETPTPATMQQTFRALCAGAMDA